MRKESIVNIVRWMARLMSMVLFLFWGAFFVEHLSWFLKPAEHPPAFVWLLQGMHLLLLIGFAVSMRWELAGSVIILASALIFLSQAAGERFLPLFSITIIPPLLYLACWWMARRANTTAVAGGPM